MSTSIALRTVLLALLLGANGIARSAATTDNPVGTDLRLRYLAPATSFNEALPLGNGRMGMMVYGGVAQARYLLSVNSMWSGSRYPEADRKDAASWLPKIR